MPPVTAPLLNWAGNFAYGAARVHRPGGVEEVREVVRRASRVKALGSRHSFNALADTTGDLVSVERLDRVLEIDRARRTATIEAGVGYGGLCRALHAAGLALPNLASLPHISVAGAVATATHGSGDRLGSLATSVRALEFVDAAGEVVALSRDADGDAFRGAVVSLGALGVVVRLTLDLVPAFEVAQVAYDHLPAERLEAHFDEVTSGAYSVSLFTDWREAGVDQVWLKHRAEPGAAFAVAPSFFGAAAAPVDRHPIRRLSAVSCTPQRGVPGPWFERLPHFRMEFTPSAGEELQSEFFVPRARALEAFRAVGALRDRVMPLLQISEVRTVAADDLWMSPMFGRDTVGIHFTWVKDWEGVRAVLPLVEEALEPFGARPHWAKLFTMPAGRVRALYPRLADFRALLARHDAGGKFRNAFLDAYVYGD